MTERVTGDAPGKESIRRAAEPESGDAPGGGELTECWARFTHTCDASARLTARLTGPVHRW
ncbi:hypothetical protein KCMC57_up39700 [Kitasatospora sp. CMC57]|uniref:Uncharacterized protein n=1 Tax=Kitasatospora sp. CMC57 TaxID=3231513 RepID=A0AB33JXE8_9ACTN